MASIKGKTVPAWREKQLLRPYIQPIAVNPASPNRKELRRHVAKSGHIVPGSDGRRLGDSPFQARLRETIRNAAELGTRKYEKL